MKISLKWNSIAEYSLGSQPCCNIFQSGWEVTGTVVSQPYDR